MRTSTAWLFLFTFSGITLGLLLAMIVGGFLGGILEGYSILTMMEFGALSMKAWERVERVEGHL